MRLEDIILRSTRALQPAATTVPVGTLYFVTDESVIERSNGTTWQSYSGTAASGITELTGDVTAGPGSGSQVASIAALAVDTAELANNAVTYAKIQDVTDVRLLGRAAGSAGDVQEITVSGLTLASGVLTGAAGAVEWTTTVVKSIDQDVTNSITLVNDSELLLAVIANEVWLIELLVLYSGTDATGDLLWDVAVSAGVMEGALHYTGLTTGNLIISAGVALAGVANGVDIGNGTLAAHGMRPLRITGFIVFSATGTFTFRFAQNNAGVGTVARCRAGSILRAKKIL